SGIDRQSLRTGRHEEPNRVLALLVTGSSSVPRLLPQLDRISNALLRLDVGLEVEGRQVVTLRFNPGGQSGRFRVGELALEPVDAGQVFAETAHRVTDGHLVVAGRGAVT